MDSDFEQLTLTEVIQLQNRLSEMMIRRFSRTLAVVFTDIVGSTEYVSHFGDEAGRRLQQRHLDRMTSATNAHGGRIVDTAGDGAFACFPSAGGAVDALVELQARISLENDAQASEHQLAVRCAVHWATVLTDGTTVSGEAVNLCARVASSASGGEIRLTRAAFLELPRGERLRCRALGALVLKGIATPVEALAFDWRDAKLFPTRVRIEETREEITLPNRDTITFGRLGPTAGRPGNDVVLALGHREDAQKISRWHFELRRRANGMVLRAVSSQSTEVDGVVVAEGQERAIAPGSVVRLADVLTLTFLGDARSSLSLDDPALNTIGPTRGR